MKALVIGRHLPDLGVENNIEVTEVRSVTFPLTASECIPVIRALLEEAQAAGQVILLQNTPGQVAVALAQISVADTAHYTVLAMDIPQPKRLGVVISVPGPRPGKVREVFSVHAGDFPAFEAAVKTAHPRAVVGFADQDEPDQDGLVGVFVEVDGPPVPFQFSHIEWLL